MKKKKSSMWFEEPEEFPVEREMNEFMRKIWERPMKFGFNFHKMLPSMHNIRMVKGFPTDMKETEDALLIKADLPGFKKEDVKLKVTPSTISISAGKKSEKQERGNTFYRHERMFGTTSRAFRLPVEVDPKGVKAKMENGVLAIILPKVEKKKVKDVEVD